MNYMKKMIALLLCLSMTLTMIPVGAFATDEDMQESEEVFTEGEDSSRTEPEEKANAYASWTDTEILAEYIRLMEAEDEESLDAFVSQLSEAQQSALINALADMVEDNPTKQSIVASGDCGDNVRWSLDSDGTLTISGTGKMTDYYTDGSPFYNRSDIKKVIINPGATSIGDYAFDGCSSLTSIAIPNSVTSIGDFAFDLCKSLTSITIPNSVTSIGWVAFGWCYGLTSITIPNSVTSIGDHAFVSCLSLTGITVSAQNPKYKSVDGILFSKDGETLICYPAGKTGSTYSIPSSVTSIGDYAFGYCSSLTSISIPNSVTSIGRYAFENCSSLTSISIPNSVTSIGGGAFWDCSSLTDVYYSGSQSQWNAIQIDIINQWLTNATIHYNSTGGSETSGKCGDNVTWTLSSDGTLTISGTGKMTDYGLGGSPFFNRTDIKEVVINSGVTSIGAYAFSVCSSLTSITIPNSVTSIGYDAFNCCSSLTSITIPNSVTSIGAAAFNCCSSLTSITIPNSVTSIGECAFYGCNSLTSIEVSAQNPKYKSIDGILFSKDGKSLICYPAGKTASTYSIPNSVTSIGDFAFSGCSSLTSITIPNSVTSIGAHAFSGCDSLTDVYYSGSQSQWNAISIDSNNDCLTNANIHFDSNGYLSSMVEFKYKSSFTNIEMKANCQYRDEWFFKSSSLYNHELATMSLAMTMSSMYTAPDRLIELMKQIGIDEDKIVTSYPVAAKHLDDPTYCMDTIGYAIGSKKVGDHILIVAVVRSGNYDQEWASNFTVGTADTHAGFQSAGNEVQKGIKDYIRQNNISGNYKIWISGFSRGAATANIAAQALNEDAANGRLPNITNQDIFAYCFECPQTTKRTNNSYQHHYGNIINIVNYSDTVTKVPLNSWNYDRYGTTIYLPASEITPLSEYYKLENAMMQNYTVLSGNHVKSEIRGRLAGIGLESESLIKLLGAVFYDTDMYSFGFQDLMRSFWKKPKSERKSFGDEVEAVFSESINNLLSASNPIYLSSTIVKNTLAELFISRLAAAHYPELCMAWMKTLDGMPSYDLHTSLIKINCPVDITVYDSAGAIVAKIVHDKVQNVGNYAISAVIDPDGQKVFAVPPRTELSFQINATDDGTLSIHTETVNIKTGTIQDVQNVYDIPISDRDELVLEANQSSQLNVSLTGADGCNIPLTKINGGSTTQYTVTAIAQEGGSVSNGGVYSEGEYAMVTAAANTGCMFTGWYEGEAQVSSEESYRFAVRGNRSLVAHFGMQNNRIYLSDCQDANSCVWIDGQKYSILTDGEYYYVELNNKTASNMITYTYHIGDATDLHTQYPTGMKVYTLKYENGSYTATYVPEFDNILQYSGSSIRVEGNKGIRMITSIDQNKKSALVGSGLANYKLVEYGTLLAQTSKLGNAPLVLGGENVRSNYAYKRGVADPVFNRVGNLVQYTNVLVGFNNEQCKEDIAMRPYMIVEDAQGAQYTIYGGIIYRSIGYIAYQNRNTFTIGGTAYKYVWDIIHNVYGNRYDAEYRR